MRSLILGCLATLISFGSAGVGQAVPVLWNTPMAVTLTGVGSSGPTSVTLHGSFTYDADFGTFDDIEFAYGTRGDASASSVPDLNTAAVSTTQQIQVFKSMPFGCLAGPGSCPENALLISFFGDDQLTNEGGVLSVNYRFYNSDIDVDEFSILQSGRSLQVASLPAGLPFFGVSLGILVLLRRKA